MPEQFITSYKPEKSSTGGVGMRRLWRTLQELPFGLGQYTQHSPVSDPLSKTFGSLLSLKSSDEPLFGMITDCTSVANVYRVSLEGLNSVLPCVLGVGASLTAVGARPLSTLQVGSRVICIIHRQLAYGVILCVVPTAASAANQQLIQQIAHTSRNRVDEAHKFPLRMPDNGMIPDMLAGRPFDATTIGEHGWITETGLRLFICPFMVQCAVDESCGVFGFLHDQLLRIAAYNLQMFTAGSERVGVNDQEEYNDWTGFTPYPWEQLGRFDRSDPRKVYTPQEWQRDLPYYGPVEPADDRAQPWHREQEYHGYLGQGGKRHVAGPPKDPPETNVFAAGSGSADDGKLVFNGLADFATGLNGQVMLGSAKGISIVKRPALPSPKRLRGPEQVSREGDNPADYRFAGLVGDGPEHKITGDIVADSEHACMQRAAGVLDLATYLFNYSAIHPFYWHEKDWHVPEESEVPRTGESAVLAPDFASLKDEPLLKPPDPEKLTVDHRYGEENFYPNESGIHWLPDGGLVLRDGFGSQILMTGGEIKLSCAGNVSLESGKNVMAWAGFDVILRARNSVDVTASINDVRIKAERNMQLLAGNGGEGGILLESRAKERDYDFDNKCGEEVKTSGIILRADNSDVVGLAKNIYLRTGDENNEGGPIVLDAARGRADVVIQAKNLRQFVDAGVYTYFGQDGNVRALNSSTEKANAFASGLRVAGATTVEGSVIVRGSIAVAGGHISTEGAGGASGLVGSLEDRSLRQMNDIVDAGAATTGDKAKQTGEDYYEKSLVPLLYDEQQPGNEDVVRLAKVSLRTVEQYRTEEYAAFESYWQQLARLSEQDLPTWDEKAVECASGGDTYPYPGESNLFAEGGYWQQNLTLFAFEGRDGGSKDRGTSPDLTEPYATPRYAAPDRVPLQGNYIVIVPEKSGESAGDEETEADDGPFLQQT